jgi:acyl-CoA synthetase (AMP-forming)/AMP-acid ligase II
MHLAYHFQRAVQRHPRRVALVEHGRTWTYAEFVDRLQRVGTALHGLGLTRGDRVAILVPDTREYLESDYGAMAAGLVRVPLDPRLTRGELLAQLSDAGARALVFGQADAERVVDLPSDLADLRSLVQVGGSAGSGTAGSGLAAGARLYDYEALLGGARGGALDSGDPTELAALNYTGGTTGRPKAVMLSHRNLVACVQNVLIDRPVYPEDVFLNVRPLWPIASVLVLVQILGGASVVLGGRFQSERFLTQLQRHRVTATSLVPTLLIRLLDQTDPRQHDLSALRTIDHGAAAIPPEVFLRALDVLGPRVGVLYGLSEAPWTSYLSGAELADPAQRERLVRTVGRELFGHRMVIRDEGGAPLPPGTPGEITIQGDHVMQGYWRQPETTALALRDGWLHTGDLGCLDADGYLSVVGRTKEVIRSGGNSILPVEVEHVLLAHPAVAEVAVIGVPNREWGENVKALVVLRPGAEATTEDLIAHCRAHLASFKQPRVVEFVKSLPRSHYGKILKKRLQ